MGYLKDEQYYIDRYDLHTIEECLDYYQKVKESFSKGRNQDPFKKYTDEKFQTEMNKCLNLMLFSLKGERYRHKKERIQEWVDRDRQAQEKYDNTPPPTNVLCKECHSPTTVTFKDLHHSFEPDARMMFMFECVKCKKRQALFEDGTEWKYDPPRCPKCKAILKSTMKKKGEVLTTSYSCPKCSYSKKEVDDFEKSHKEWEEKEAHDKELLTKYRGDFVLSDKEGLEYVETMEAMKVANEVYKEEVKEYDQSAAAYEKVSQLNKLGVVELEKLLSEALEKEGCIKLSLDKPQINQRVIVPFTVQDSNSSRNSRESTYHLAEVIKKSLENTNWRLTSDGLSYRLGYVSGNLRGYEQEEELLEISGKKKESKPSPVDSQKRMKYEWHNLVQLARMMGKWQGVENVRKKRLEKEPDGFLLNDGKVGYTCGICRESISGDRTWWDLRGIRCLDCQRNLKEGVVPLEIFEEDYGYDVVLKESDLKSDYGIHPATVRKLHREGILKGRDLRRRDGTIYETLYVVRENQKFLKDHPKIDPKIEVVIRDKDEK